MEGYLNYVIVYIDPKHSYLVQYFPHVDTYIGPAGPFDGDASRLIKICEIDYESVKVRGHKGIKINDEFLSGRATE